MKTVLKMFCLLFCLMTGIATMGAQEAQQLGTVADVNNEPLIGVSVFVKGTATGTATGMDGKFSIQARPGDVLQISYVGYVTGTVTVGSDAVLNIVLEEDQKTLDEVVVVGYGTQRKINLSGSVDQISAKQLEAKPVTNIAKALQGMAPNLNIDFNSGEPGKAANINIRGTTSINGGSPLVLIDGVPSDSEELNRLQPEDIESVSIIKDASSAAIYGARASFGIILITTKQGNTENVQVSYNNNFSWARPSVLPEKKDWTEYFLDKNTFSNTHQLAVSGTAGKAKFYLSGGYDGENGILSGIVNDDSYTRYNLRSKINYKIRDFFTLSNNAEREGIISTSLPTVGLASGEQKVSGQYKDWAIRSLFYRANYIYDNRYIVEFNGRYDGTSRFPKDKRFGFFPSASAAWRIDSESFFEPARPVVSQLKLRASYGSLGNQLVSEYGYISTMSSSPANYIIGGTIPQKVSSPSLVSGDYSWEKVYTQNLGVDVGFPDQKLTATFDIYRRDTKDMLIKGKELPAVLGTSEPNENAGDMKTTGWELTVSCMDKFNLAGKPLSWSAKFILSDSRSWITRYDNPTGVLTDYYKGMELGEMWGLQSDGLFRSTDEISRLDVRR